MAGTLSGYCPKEIRHQGEGAGKGPLISYFERFPVPLSLRPPSYLPLPPPPPPRLAGPSFEGGQSFLLGRAAWSLGLNP